jgi:hypothetical protein
MSKWELVINSKVVVYNIYLYNSLITNYLKYIFLYKFKIYIVLNIVKRLITDWFHHVQYDINSLNYFHRISYNY